MNREILHVSHLTKGSNGRPLLEDINLAVFAGEHVGIVGLQSTGKSVLSGILMGEICPDTGNVYVDGKSVVFGSISEAQKYGIYRVSDHIQLMENMSIAENLFVVRGMHPKSFAFSNRKIIASARIVLESFGMERLDSNAKIRSLSRTDKRLIEFIKIVLAEPKIIIIDSYESFDVDSGSRFKKLFDQIMRKGISILTISNKFDWGVLNCSRFYPLRDGILGKNIVLGASPDMGRMYKALTGSEYPRQTERGESSRYGRTGQVPLLEVKEFVADQKSLPVSFSIYSGEIAAIIPRLPTDARVLAYAIAGDKSPAGGTLSVKSVTIKTGDMDEAIRNGIVFVSDHQAAGTSMVTMTVSEYLTTVSILLKKKSGIIVNKRVNQFSSKKLVDYFGINCRDTEVSVRKAGLSSTDAQKLAMARWMMCDPKVFILLNPFMNTDEQTSGDLIVILRKLAEAGKSILIITNDIYKLNEACDRVITV